VQKPSLKIDDYSNLRHIYRSLVNYKINFELYFNDNFILKPDLFYAFKMIKIRLFKVDPIPEKVLFGSKGWMFLGDSWQNVIRTSKGIDRYDFKEIEFIVTNLKNRNKWLKERNIEYYVALAPNKHNVYGKYLRINHSKKPTKVQQVVNAFKKSNFKIIELVDGLKHDTLKVRTFHKTNSHWNDYGAFLGYDELINNLRENYPFIPKLNIGDFVIDSVISKEPLANMIQSNQHEVRIILKPKINKLNATMVEDKLIVPRDYFRKPDDFEMRYVNKTKPLKILIFRDSFCSAMLKYIIESFGEVVFIWTDDFNISLIENEKPDIVIHELIERKLDIFLRK